MEFGRSLSPKYPEQTDLQLLVDSPQRMPVKEAMVMRALLFKLSQKAGVQDSSHGLMVGGRFPEKTQMNKIREAFQGLKFLQ